MEPSLLSVLLLTTGAGRKGWIRLLVFGGIAALVTNLGWVSRFVFHIQLWPGHDLFVLHHPGVVVVGNLVSLGLIAWGIVRLVTQADETLSLARSLARRGDYEGAADLYLRARRPRKALDCYRRGRAWSHAAQVALDLGRDREAAVDLTRAGGNHLADAARIYRRIGDNDAARRCHGDLAEWHSREGRFDEAIAAWLRAGETIRAARAAALALSENRLFPTHPAFATARRAAEEARDWELLAQMGELEGSWAEAGRTWRRAGRLDRAAEAFRRADELDQAASAWESAGQTREALLIRLQQLRRLGLRRHHGQLDRAGQNEMAATVADLLPQLESAGLEEEVVEALTLVGRHEDAVNRLVAAGEPTRAAQLAVDHELWDLAGPLLERAGRWGEASDVYELGHRFDAAAACAERTGEDERAMELYRSAGLTAEMARCMARLGRLQEAIIELHRADLMAEAWELLRSQPGPLPDIPDVLLDLAAWLRQERSLEEAIACLQRAVIGVALAPGRLDTAVALARLLQEAGEISAALAQLERVLEFDFSFTPAKRLRQELLAPLSAAAARHAPATPAEDRYEILTEVGRGGMGVVYKAHDRRLDRAVAIKVLRTTSSEEIARLESEARAAATLSHPGIVTVYDFESGFGGHFIAMEYVPGEPLDTVVRTSPERVRNHLLRILVQVTDAVAYAHSKGVIHRDLKPGNILLTAEGEVKIYDFGIAARIGSDDRSSGGSACGTPFYMAPEQIRGRPPTPASDIYSLGATFFHLATGRPPFRRGNVIAAHLEQAPPDPLILEPQLPRSLGNVILRCLEKSPEARFSSAAELADTLRTAPFSATV